MNRADAHITKWLPIADALEADAGKANRKGKIKCL